MDIRNQRMPANANARRERGSREAGAFGMTAAIEKRRWQASRCSRRRSLRYFTGGTRTAAWKTRTTIAPNCLADSSRRAANRGRDGWRSGVGRWLPSVTWSRTRSPSPPSHPWSVVKWGL
jgi:hypothetical protein